ncbi:MAG: hypothetical protein K8L99_33790 [Anaerolineae bacterium]|nr:hypothetical protein [Anaerolineae bacterium]
MTIKQELEGDQRSVKPNYETLIHVLAFSGNSTPIRRLCELWKIKPVENHEGLIVWSTLRKLAQIAYLYKTMMADSENEMVMDIADILAIVPDLPQVDDIYQSDLNYYYVSFHRDLNRDEIKLMRTYGIEVIRKTTIRHRYALRLLHKEE